MRSVTVYNSFVVYSIWAKIGATRFIPFIHQMFLQGAISLARSLKVVNEALVSLDLGFNEIRV